MRRQLGNTGFILVLLITLSAASARAQLPNWQSKLDPVLLQRASLVTGRSRVIVRVVSPNTLPGLNALIGALGGTLGRSLPVISATVATIPNAVITALAAFPLVAHVSIDRGVAGAMERTGPTVGAPAARQEFGVDGSGIGVAVIDSGVTAWHDDLSLNNRVTRFVDFVGMRTSAYDDYGHGTHVAGIIAGSGYDSGGARSGIAPGASLVVLKALNASGGGRISDVIAAIGYAIANKTALNIRVLNLSIAAAVAESYNVDPLTLAAQAAVNSGIVVVAASGNNGRSVTGQRQYGGVASPGNAPWVLTVGASSHMGTIDRGDDTIAAFSSRGPTAIDATAKPDLVAPAVGIESLSNPASAMYSTKAAYLLPGTIPTTYLPYLSLSGTSMATPVVSGTVALMLQANPSLTPNAVKAILQYTSQIYARWDPLTEGAGFLNSQGAVELAREFADPSSAMTTASMWGRRLIWGNRSYRGGDLASNANAWTPGVAWGATNASPGRRAAWGPSWNTSSPSRNVVWGTRCGGANCTGAWTPLAASDGNGDGVVWGTTDGDTVVWGTTDGDTVVWGTSDADTVVWGTNDDGDTVVWGTSDVDGVVWGTSDDGDGVVWGTSCGDPSCEPVIWGH
jgi:serine protease AprX